MCLATTRSSPASASFGASAHQEKDVTSKLGQTKINAVIPVDSWIAIRAEGEILASSSNSLLWALVRPSWLAAV
jgi:hypothetical protein